MKKEERADGIVPRESVEQDEELCREINERIKEESYDCYERI